MTKQYLNPHRKNAVSEEEEIRSGNGERKATPSKQNKEETPGPPPALDPCSLG